MQQPWLIRLPEGTDTQTGRGPIFWGQQNPQPMTNTSLNAGLARRWREARERGGLARWAEGPVWRRKDREDEGPRAGPPEPVGHSWAQSQCGFGGTPG